MCRKSVFESTTMPLRRWFLRKWKKWVAGRLRNKPTDVELGSAPQVTLRFSLPDDAETNHTLFSAARELKSTGKSLVCEGVGVSNSELSDWRGTVRDYPHPSRRIHFSIGKKAGCPPSTTMISTTLVDTILTRVLSRLRAHGHWIYIL